MARLASLARLPRPLLLLSAALSLQIPRLLAGCGAASNDPAAPVPGPVEIVTTAGTIRGSLDGTTRIFRGIPYAQPPIGDLRFRAPRPMTPWSGTREVATFGPSCSQNSISGVWSARSSEDCLTLNIWTPSVPGDGHRPVPVPVMVWIHGGGFQLGAGSDSTYDGQLLSETRGVIVVTLNYRLGPLGFLAHPGLSAEDSARRGVGASGNWGLMDQQLALGWVKGNIERFGGDPNHVTLFGQSAGAYSVCAQLLSPGAAGLFERAIIESGFCTSLPSPSLAAAEAQGTTLASALGCAGEPATQVACLRGKTNQQITTALPGKPGLIGASGYAWGGIVDGAVLADQPRALMAAGKGARVPLIVGANADEGTLFFAIGAGLADETELRAAFANQFSREQLDKVVAEYPVARYGSANAAAIQLIGDAFVCEARRMASRATGAAYLYHFPHPFKWLYPDLGAFHSGEIPFVFGNPYQTFKLQESELPLSAAMQDAWTRFATTGDPNGAGLPQWQPYNARTDQAMRFDVPEITRADGVRARACAFFDSL